MKIFTKILSEALNSDFTIDKEHFNEYKNAISETKRSKEFMQLLWLTEKYPELLNKEKVEDLIKGKNTLDTNAKDIAKDFIKLVKKVNDEIKLLPQLLSLSQREAVIHKKINVEDLTLDLESQKGRDAIARKYIPLIEKMIKGYVDKSPLSKEELRSAAMVGLIKAMDEYKNPEELEIAGKTGNMSFTSYAAYRIKQQILKDINEFSRNVKISKYFQGKLKDEGDNTFKELSIDNLTSDKDDDKAMSIDRFFALSDDDEEMSSSEKEELYKKLFRYIESKFSSRDCIVFYKVWGVNGYKREKSKDIAKELGISAAAVAQICSRIIKFVKNDKKAKQLFDAFESLVNDYVAGKLLEVYSKDKNTIVESFIYDDIYLLLENESKWTKDKFMMAVNNATKAQSIEDALFIFRMLEGKIKIDEKTIKKNKGTVEMFLNTLFPNKSYNLSNIDTLIDEMQALKEIADNFNINW